VRAIIDFKQKYDGLSPAEQYDQKIDFDGEASHYYVAEPEDLQDLLDFLDDAAAGEKAPRGPLNQGLGLKGYGGGSSGPSAAVLAIAALGAGAAWALYKKRKR